MVYTDAAELNDTSYNFAPYHPNYFKIEASEDDAVIYEISFTYSCISEEYAPESNGKSDPEDKAVERI